ncbi:signal peptidase II [Halobacillus halophilus]|uniref:Lipoprotein signal peptidase n=1 Tax=Halobacillus halophilus (strain ATCC 35676 / DSM 2266 / JCM 20832 / KCTC 3685 / LMG 17431 / NBRC 102448 / NCIMB 2269) TaxID=866895 RepID=I0JM70_HALH3|nr:signal peptidase II [Halobacillus halophilus]ASF39329.1 signal peptidase II [Halobacillus halophilus]CCG45240.1 lipoprotein signal peptidase [Halobacillus halophilus DSM 2266]
MYVYYIIALAIIILDQWTKWLVVSNMQIGESIPVIENFFYLTSHRNQGAAWGILQGQMWFFYIITIIVIGVVIYYMQQFAKESRLAGVSLSLILGGAIGNFIDRVFRKEVVDFADTLIFTYDFPIFNVADSALVIGVILVMLATLLDERKKKGSLEQ